MKIGESAKQHECHIRRQWEAVCHFRFFEIVGAVRKLGRCESGCRTVEWKWLEDVLHPTTTSKVSSLEPAQEAATQFLRQIVFTHMDMQSLNFLRDSSHTNADLSGSSSSADDDDSPIKVIDFEYAGFNPRAVDMANTFCEHCDMNNIKADYENEYPSADVQNAFLKTYVQHTLALLGTHSSNGDKQPQPSSPEDSQRLRALLEPYVDDPVFLAAARQEIGRYTLVSHTSWAIWSIVQSNMSDIDFDYVGYAQHRMDGFEYMKKRFFGSS